MGESSFRGRGNFRGGRGTGRGGRGGNADSDNDQESI